MSTCSVFIATSIDGFIAGKDDDISWLEDPEWTIEGEDFGYNEFISSVDAIIMGRKSYDVVRSFGEWPYSKPVVVLTSQEYSVPDELEGKLHFMNGSPAEIIYKLKSSGWNHLYIDGAKTIQQFLNAGFISRIIITRVPVLIGEGTPLFNSASEKLKFKLESSVSYPNGFVQLTYKPDYNQTLT